MQEKIGKIDIARLKHPPEKHELDTARFFAERGHDIEFIPPSNMPDVHTADIKMDGLEWEIKCPKGKAKRTIEQNFRIATKQSLYIIFDLRRSMLPEEQSIRKIEKEFEDRKVKKLKVILKSGKLLEYPKKD